MRKITLITSYDDSTDLNELAASLDFLQKPDRWFSVGAKDISLRRCLET